MLLDWTYSSLAALAIDWTCIATALHLNGMDAMSMNGDGSSWTQLVQ